MQSISLASVYISHKKTFQLKANRPLAEKCKDVTCDWPMTSGIVADMTENITFPETIYGLETSMHESD